MARTSKRYIRKNEEQAQKVFYKTGVYTRLSSERKEEWREKSSSIETQVLCCKEYALKENIKVVNIYTDYEYSGTNFEIPQFQEMMQDIRERRINCIIIKDLSRLGREYLEMGRIIDKVFPFLGVRFISVNDKVDTVKDLDSKKSFEVTLKNIVNDMYAKDISVKIKTSKHNRARNGYFIGSVPPYGYKVVKLKEGQKLEVDDNVRFIVEEMFQLTLEGKSQYEVTKHFNTKGYATGMVYYKTGRIYRQDGDPQRNKATISKMLTNRAYTGTLVQGVKQQYVDESQHIIYENAHELIISKEDFEKVLQGRADRLKNNAFGAEMHNFERDYENRYKGLIFNNATGRELYRRTRIYGINHDRLYYSFQNDTCTGKIDNEVRVFIMERELDKAMSEKVAEFITKATSKAKLIESVSARFYESIDKLNEDISKLKTKTGKEELLIQKAYEEYSLGKIDREEYSLKREIALSHIATINSEVISVEKVVKDLERDRKIAVKWIKDVFSAKKIEKLSADLIHSLV
ncbi:site-specific recombinase, TnpX family protein [Ureaplasma urealyticum serovar 2 str. ATCC 27814]|nr:recombinase family protein [Ureaplasma urealyticum]EEH02448.1 site-specific recombinase, TnpX family protein [Ureaplasma urealyticum serovar 2 str. ATCC 27814]